VRLQRRGEAVDLRLAISDGFENEGCEHARHAEVHLVGASSAVTRIDTDRIAPLPILTRALNRW
jgi:hypothetical protein